MPAWSATDASPARNRRRSSADGATAPELSRPTRATGDQDTSRATAVAAAANSEWVRRVIAQAGPPDPDAVAELRRLLPPVQTMRPAATPAA